MSQLVDRLLRRAGYVPAQLPARAVGAPAPGHTPSPNYRWRDLDGAVIYVINTSGDPREVSATDPLPVDFIKLFAGEDLVNNVLKTELRSGYANINTAATTVVKNGAGRLIALTLNTPVASASLTLYDNIAGSGTKIGTITLPATLLGQGPQNVFVGGGAFSTGLTAVTVGTADWTLWYI